MLGLHNIADGAAEDGAYPQLSAGYVAEADPDLIVLAHRECCGHPASRFKQRPGMRDITAVRNGDVVAVSDGVASGWGPRVVDLIETVADRVEEMQDRG